MLGFKFNHVNKKGPCYIIKHALVVYFQALKHVSNAMAIDGNNPLSMSYT